MDFDEPAAAAPAAQQQQQGTDAAAAAGGVGAPSPPPPPEREWLIADKQQVLLDELLAMGVLRQELVDILADMGQDTADDETLVRGGEGGWGEGARVRGGGVWRGGEKAVGAGGFRGVVVHLRACVCMCVHAALLQIQRVGDMQLEGSSLGGVTTPFCGRLCTLTWTPYLAPQPSDVLCVCLSLSAPVCLYSLLPPPLAGGVG